MSELYPETETSEASREGTAAHEVMEALLKDGELFPIGHICSNGVAVTDDMVYGATLIANAVREVRGPTSNGELRVEQRIDMPSIHPDCWGTPDVSLYIGSELHVWDYKFGYGFVEVYKNWQLIEYVEGLLRHYDIDGYADQHLMIHMHIVQPRCYHPEGQIRTWSIRASDMRALFNEARAFEAAAAADNAPCRVSEECNHCPARHACPTLQHAALNACDRAGESNPFDLPPDALGYEAATLDRSITLMQARMTGLQAQIESKLQAGQFVPHWALKRGQGKTIWRVPAEQVAAFGDMMGVDLRKKMDVITPTQAKKLKLDVALIEPFTEYVPGSLKVERDDGSLAARVFDTNVNK